MRVRSDEFVDEGSILCGVVWCSVVENIATKTSRMRKDGLHGGLVGFNGIRLAASGALANLLGCQCVTKTW